jgi:hypothetical protein
MVLSYKKKQRKFTRTRHIRRIACTKKRGASKKRRSRNHRRRSVRKSKLCGGIGFGWMLPASILSVMSPTASAETSFLHSGTHFGKTPPARQGIISLKNPESKTDLTDTGIITIDSCPEGPTAGRGICTSADIPIHNIPESLQKMLKADPTTSIPFRGFSTDEHCDVTKPWYYFEHGITESKANAIVGATRAAKDITHENNACSIQGKEPLGDNFFTVDVTFRSKSNKDVILQGVIDNGVSIDKSTKLYQTRGPTDPVGLIMFPSYKLDDFQKEMGLTKEEMQTDDRFEFDKNINNNSALSSLKMGTPSLRGSKTFPVIFESVDEPAAVNIVGEGVINPTKYSRFEAMVKAATNGFPARVKVNERQRQHKEKTFGWTMFLASTLLVLGSCAIITTDRLAKARLLVDAFARSKTSGAHD